jgi:hypothetical protein
MLQYCDLLLIMRSCYIFDVSWIITIQKTKNGLSCDPSIFDIGKGL